MITTSTWERRDLFKNERWANLLIDTIYHYRGAAYLLHEFVIMPDHLHALLEIWQKGFSDHRIRDAGDYRVHSIYIRQNPLRKHLCERPEQFPYSSASGRLELDGVPQGLKPSEELELCGAPEGAPFQSKSKRQKNPMGEPLSQRSTTKDQRPILHA